MRKRVLSGILVLVLTLTMGSTALAKETTDKTTKEVTTNESSSEMKLEGKVGTPGADLISVVLPSSINFQIGTEGEQAFKEIISATGTIENLSTSDVNITLEEVTDTKGLLGMVDLALAPVDKTLTDAMASNMLVVGTARNMLLGKVAAGGGTLPLKVFGQAKASSKIVDGEYNITTILKVTAVTATP
ncbi:hypothetical protein [Anaerolentibacter hominis]|uniref:hypothetical protein n=1 Tax=Anaerolentibacter hominis TaxID=3079009 RepID=UPI0031B81B8D